MIPDPDIVTKAQVDALWRLRPDARAETALDHAKRVVLFLDIFLIFPSACLVALGVLSLRRNLVMAVLGIGGAMVLDGVYCRLRATLLRSLRGGS